MSRELRTSLLPGTHVSVGYCWQNSRSCHSEKCMTATSATSCRTRTPCSRAGAAPATAIYKEPGCRPALVRPATEEPAMRRESPGTSRREALFYGVGQPCLARGELANSAWFRNQAKEVTKPERGVTDLHSNLHRNGTAMLPGSDPGPSSHTRHSCATPQAAAPLGFRASLRVFDGFRPSSRLLVWARRAANPA